MENNQLQAVTELWNLLFSFQKSMALKCALELGIADAISNHGQPMTLSQLHSALSLPSSKKPYLHRLMRLMTHFCIFCEAEASAGSESTTYELAPLSRLVTTTKVEPLNLLPFARFHLSDVMVTSYLCMGEWFKQEEKLMPFELAHGIRPWQFASRNPEISKLFDDAMVRSSCLFTNAIVKNGTEIFKGIRSLIDVAGGAGAISKAIAENFSHVKCTVLDLPHVVGNFPNNGTVQFVSGDMFEYIPPADAVLLKWVLHCWSDENCIKILRRCKDAIPSREAGGKVFLLEAVVGLTSSTAINEEPQLLFDLMMMTTTEGGERDEHEWNRIFTEAGFSSYKIIQTIGFMSIIEIYP